jgi:phosphoribosylformylglycinamidine synthase PurS subunit
MRYSALVEVRTRPGIADPAGATIEAALPALGFGEVDGVRVGKAIRLSVEARDEASALARLSELCEVFLANPVMEEVSIELTGQT